MKAPRPQVGSPLQAILDYETAHGIPPGWINQSIAQSGPQGAWQQLERGEIPLDAAFHAAWKRDLADAQRWRAHWVRHLARLHGESSAPAAPDNVPPVPDIDTRRLHAAMIAASRSVDPRMGAALRRLRRHADRHPGALVLGALSNTVIVPGGESDGGGTQRLDARVFDVFVSSAHVGLRKPEPEVYRFAVARVGEFVRAKGWGGAGVRAQDVVFLDDIGANLKPARSMGMRTIKVGLGKTNVAVAELEAITGLGLADEPSRL